MKKEETNIINDKKLLITRYLNGILKDTEKKDLTKWICESKKNKKLFFEKKDLWDTCLKPSVDVKEQLLQFYKKQSLRQKKTNRSLWISTIAVAAILVTGLFWGILFPHISSYQKQAESFYVPAGSKSQITLSDGTKITLNAESHIKLCDNFSEKNRNLYLNGEAYFEVKSDKRHPFFVKTENIKIKVTGTKFNVCSYSEDKTTSVFLNKGHVCISSNNSKNFDLTPGEKFIFDRNTKGNYIKNADEETETAWLKGNFILNEISFPDLIRKLERSYNVKLNYTSKQFNAMKYTGKFRNQETIWQVLNALKLTTPIEYERIGFREFNLKYKPM